MTQQVAIVLGGTAPHIELIRQLQERGYRVVLVDYLPNPPAKGIADIHEQVSTLDNEAVLEVAIRYSAKLIISACVDQANITACYVAEKLGLPHPYSYQLASNITNKGYMKKMMWENDIPTTKYIFLDDGDVLNDFSLHFPVMVKPADSCAASGVKKANNLQELSHFLAEAKKVSRTGRAVIEEFFSGTEVSVYAFVEQGVAKILMISERLSVIEGDNQVLKCYATVTPPHITEGAQEKIEEYTTRIARLFSLDNTPLHVQFMCNRNDVSVIEFAPRVGGGLSYENIKKCTGFDMIGATIDSYLQNTVKCVPLRTGKVYTVNLVYGRPSLFGRLSGTEELLSKGVIDEVHMHRCPGSRITDDKASGGRIAAILISGDTRAAVLNKIKITFDIIDALDVEGNSIIRRDLHLTK